MERVKVCCMSTRPGKEVMLELTDACNFDCVYCARSIGSEKFHGGDQTLSGSMLTKALALIEHFRPERVQITGGEPFYTTVQPYLDETIAFLEKMGCSFSISTNGSRLNQATLQRLGRYRKFAHLNISLDSIDLDVHRAITNNTSGHAVILEAIANLHNYGLSCRVLITATNAHLPTLQETIDWAVEQPGVGGVTVFPVAPFGISETRVEELLNGSGYAALGLLAQKYKGQQAVSFGRIQAGGVPLSDCNLSENRFAIDTQGNVLICPNLYNPGHSGLPRSNVNSDSPEDCLRSLVTLKASIAQIEKDIPECNACVQYSSVCGRGCRVAALGSSGFLGGRDPLCPRVFAAATCP